ncbi:MAG TPA: hypothetical protein VFI02_14140 [Armatimonadota bacterium]|nr:hypothetical protein [Armatimonadota bacterium]
MIKPRTWRTKKRRRAIEKARREVFWNSSQLSYLRSAYNQVTTKAIADKLGRSPQAVRKQASRMGLVKGPLKNLKRKAPSFRDYELGAHAERYGG